MNLWLGTKLFLLTGRTIYDIWCHYLSGFWGFDLRIFFGGGGLVVQ